MHLRSFLDPARRWPWLVLAALIKALTFAYFVHHNSASAGSHHFAIDFGDTWSYLDPIDALLAHGSYTPDYRMPGYGAPFLVLRLFLDTDAASNALVLLQLCCSILALYSAARIAGHVFSSSRAFVVAFVLLGASMFVSAFDPQLATESFCASAIVLMLHALLKAQAPGASLAWWTITGILLAWCVFLRPVCVLIIPPIALVILFRRGMAWRLRLKHAMLVLLPFAVADAAWTARNLRVHHDVRPLANGMFYPEWTTSPMFAITRFVQLYGGTTIWWDSHSDIRWFNVRNLGDPLPAPGTTGQPPPTWILTEQVRMDSLQALADLMARAHDLRTDSTERRLLIADIFARTDRYCASAQREHPFGTQVRGRLHCLWNFLWQGGAARLYFNPWEETPLAARVVKVVQGALYLFVVLVGLLGALRLLLRRSATVLGRVIPWIVVPGVLISPLVFRFCDYRYIVPMFPLLAICAVGLVPGIRRRPQVPVAAGVAPDRVA